MPTFGCKIVLLLKNFAASIIFIPPKLLKNKMPRVGAGRGKKRGEGVYLNKDVLNNIDLFSRSLGFHV